jgi:hypothetical protein
MSQCDIQEFSTCEEFKALFWDKGIPGIARRDMLRDQPEDFIKFRDMSSRKSLLNSKLSIKLSTSVSYTGRVYVEKTVGDYVMDDTPASRLGNETFYLFGNHEGAEWNDFLSQYPRLERSSLFACLKLDPAESSLSFGTAKAGTGVPWHFQ